MCRCFCENKSRLNSSRIRGKKNSLIHNLRFQETVLWSRFLKRDISVVLGFFFFAWFVFYDHFKQNVICTSKADVTPKRSTWINSSVGNSALDWGECPHHTVHQAVLTSGDNRTIQSCLYVHKPPLRNQTRMVQYQKSQYFYDAQQIAAHYLIPLDKASCVWRSKTAPHPWSYHHV